jgi:multidrug resistance efflux pump
MSQVNVNPSDRGDRSGAAVINLVTVLIVVAVLLVVGWWLFTAGPFGAGTRDVNVNVNVPKVEQPAQPPASKP